MHGHCVEFLHLAELSLHLGENFLLVDLRTRPTVISWKVEKKYFKNYFFILSADSKYYLFG